MIGKILLNSIDICTRLINLVDRYDDRNVSCLGMADRLNCLRLNAIVSRNYKHCDVCNLCASSTHSRKRFVSRSVEEYNFLAVDLDLRSTDVLRYSSGLTGCNIGVTDSIEQRSLAVINVPHYSDDRCARFEFAFLILVQIQPFLNDILMLFGHDNLYPQILSQHFNRILVESLIHSCHDAQLHQRHDDLAYRYLGLLSQTGNGDWSCDCNSTFWQQLFNLNLRLRNLWCLFLSMLNLLLEVSLIEEA